MSKIHLTTKLIGQFEPIIYLEAKNSKQNFQYGCLHSLFGIYFNQDKGQIKDKR